MKFLALIKKEFRRFFCDPRLILTMLLPGFLIYAIYSLMGSFMHEETKYEFKVLRSGNSAAFERVEQIIAATDNMTLVVENTEDEEGAKEKVKSGEATALIVFESDFDEKIKSEAMPSVEIYYRSSDEASGTFYGLFENVMNGYKNRFLFKSGEGYDFSTREGIAADMMSGILPSIVVAMIFSSCMGVTLESVAGEKERGTLATILVTSVKRSHIALGKILSLSCISLLGALSSFLGIALSMPKLMGASIGVLGGYSFLSYFLIFLSIAGITPLIVSLMSAVSTFSRSVKEASAYTSIIMILAMVLSLALNFVSGIGNWIAAFPFVNMVAAMQKVLAHTAPVWFPFTAFAVNLVYIALLTFAIVKMLSSERIIFGK